MIEGAQLPAFTRLVMGISDMVKNNILMTMGILAAFVVSHDLCPHQIRPPHLGQVQLKVPVIGPVVNKVAISRFTRTFGTLVSKCVPILQALTIVKETAGNVIVSKRGRRGS